MPSVPDTIRDFLDQTTIGVAGVSRSTAQPANAIYRRLKETGHRVFATNPSATEVEGDVCYPDLASVPEPMGGVVIATHPDAATGVVRECIGLRVPRVWMHRSFGEGSVSPEAVELCRKHGITVIAGGCPMMYCGRVDPFHRCVRWVLGVRGRIEVPGVAQGPPTT